jgi:hypothetical protein
MTHTKQKNTKCIFYKSQMNIILSNNKLASLHTSDNKYYDTKQFRDDVSGNSYPCFLYFIVLIVILFVGFIVLLIRSHKMKQKKIAALSVISIIVLSLVAAWAFNYYRTSMTSETSYQLIINHVEGSFSLGDIGIDNNSYNNITNTTFVFEIRLSNPNLTMTVPLLYTNKTLIVDTGIRNEYHPQMNLRVNRTIRFHLVVNSSDPDINNIRLFGENNFVNGSVMINGWKSMTFIPERSFNNFTWIPGEDSRYTLIFNGHFTITLRGGTMLSN